MEFIRDLFRKMTEEELLEEKGYRKVEESQYYHAKPQFYQDKAGNLKGAFAFSEGVLTLFEKNPAAHHLLDGQEASGWDITLFSIADEKNLGRGEYSQVLGLLKQYNVGEDEEYIFIKPLTHEEIVAVAKKTENLAQE